MIFELLLDSPERRSQPGRGLWRQGSKFRRLVVIEPGSASSKCLAIKTYENKATTHPDIRAKQHEHAIIHTGQPPKPLPGENGLRRPIRALTEKREKGLNTCCRLNYGDIFNVSHSEKVCCIGHISEQSMADFVEDFRAVHRSQYQATVESDHEDLLEESGRTQVVTEEAVEIGQPATTDEIGHLSRFLVSTLDPPHGPVLEDTPLLPELEYREGYTVISETRDTPDSEHSITLDLDLADLDLAVLDQCEYDPDQADADQGKERDEPEQVETEHLEPEHLKPEHLEPEHLKPEHLESEPVELESVELGIPIPEPDGVPESLEPLNNAPYNRQPERVEVAGEAVLPIDQAILAATVEDTFTLNQEADQEWSGMSFLDVRAFQEIDNCDASDWEKLSVSGTSASPNRAVQDAVASEERAPSQCQSDAATETTDGQPDNDQPSPEPLPPFIGSTHHESKYGGTESLSNQQELPPSVFATVQDHSLSTNPEPEEASSRSVEHRDFTHFTYLFSTKECEPSRVNSQDTFTFFQLIPEEIRPRPVPSSTTAVRRDLAQTSSPEQPAKPGPPDDPPKLGIMTDISGPSIGCFPSEPTPEIEEPTAEMEVAASPTLSPRISPKTRLDSTPDELETDHDELEPESKVQSPPPSISGCSSTPETSSPVPNRATSPEPPQATFTAPAPNSRSTADANLDSRRYPQDRYSYPQAQVPDPSSQYQHTLYSAREQNYHGYPWSNHANNPKPYQPYILPLQPPMQHGYSPTYPRFSPPPHNFPISPVAGPSNPFQCDHYQRNSSYSPLHSRHNFSVGHQPPPPAPPPPPPPPTAGLNGHHDSFISFNLQPFTSSRASSTHPFAHPHPHTPTSSTNSNVSNVSNIGTVGTAGSSPSSSSSHVLRDNVIFPPCGTPKKSVICCALLDTAASHNFISGAKVAENGLKRQPYHGPELRFGDGHLVMPKYVVTDLQWRFHERGKTVWTDDFMVMPRMAQDVVVGREVILQRAFLLPNAELKILGLGLLSKEERKAKEKKVKEDLKKEAEKTADMWQKALDRRKQKGKQKEEQPLASDHDEWSDCRTEDEW